MRYVLTLERVASDSPLDLVVNGENVTFPPNTLIYGLILEDEQASSVLFAFPALPDGLLFLDNTLEHNGNVFTINFSSVRHDPVVTYTPASGSSVPFLFAFDDHLLSQNNGAASDSSFFTSLNGKYGSFPDGTSVTVANKEGVFKVKSSELFWNDNDTKEYMIAYVLADSLGNFLMVPDIHVSLVKLTDLVS